MKIAHIADIHWGIGYPGPAPTSRFDDITRTMDWVAEQIIGEQVDLVLVAGDLFKDSRVYIDRASEEIRAAVQWLRKLTDAALPVIIISGTPSHDPVSAYSLIDEMCIPGLAITTDPRVLDIRGQNLSIMCIPGMNRSDLVAQDEYRTLPAHEIHQVMTERLTSLCQSMLTNCPGKGNAKILLTHFTYDLADKGFEDVLMKHEPVLTPVAVAGYDLVCLGHIHRPQQNGNVYYSGSPQRLSFNDEKITPGFWIHELSGESRFIETPARRFVSVSLEETQIQAAIGCGYDPEQIDSDQVRDAIIRVHYSCRPEIHKMLDRRALERAFYDAGAWYISEIKADVGGADREQDERVTDNLGPLEALEMWCGNQGKLEDETEELRVRAAFILEEVAA